jgi:hypothetical protein
VAKMQNAGAQRRWEPTLLTPRAVDTTRHGIHSEALGSRNKRRPRDPMVPLASENALGSVNDTTSVERAPHVRARRLSVIFATSVADGPFRVCSTSNLTESPSASDLKPLPRIWL